jgi:hypothetical protein
MFKLDKVIGFLPTKDAKRARAFFEGTLGLQFVSDDTYALVIQSGATMIRIARVEDFAPVPYTVLGWEVQNIESVVSDLKTRGVVFENYPFIQNQSSESGNLREAPRWPGSKIRTEMFYRLVSTPD